MTEKPTSSVNFRKLLLNRCQKEFEKDKVDDVVFERRQKELDSTASVRDVAGRRFAPSQGRSGRSGLFFKSLFHVSFRRLSAIGSRKSWRRQRTRLGGVLSETLSSSVSCSSSRC